MATIKNSSIQLNQWELFEKAVRVIGSCETVKQLDNARKFVDLFFKHISTPSRVGEDVVYADDESYFNYRMLQALVIQQKQKIEVD